MNTISLTFLSIISFLSRFQNKKRIRCYVFTGLLYQFIFFCCFPEYCFSQKLFVSPGNKNLSYEGRIIIDRDTAQLMWPATSVTINFKGTNISGEFRDGDTSNYYNVIIDKDSIYKIHFDTSKSKYALAANLPYGKHSVQLFKRTEWDKGKTWFYGFEFNGKTTLLKASKPKQRKIEFYGNSITCGYAIEDTKNDSYAGYYENSYDAYAAITARHFDAELYCIAKSGIGIMLSWFPLIMPQMYDRLDPTDSTSKWDFSKYTPDLIVINLLQNDSWLIEKPDHEQFKSTFGTQKPDEAFIILSYKNFLLNIRSKYPHAKIICMLGNMDITRTDSPWPLYVQKAVDQIHDGKIFTFFAPYKKTPGHPKTSEQKILAESLIDFIDRNIKW